MGLDCQHFIALCWLPFYPHGIRPLEGIEMFNKTRGKLEDKYLTPVRQTMVFVTVVAVAAFLMALAALVKGK